MRIAFVCNTLSNGGAERFTANIANSFSEKHEVFVVTEARKEIEYEINGNIHRLCFLKSKRLLLDSIRMIIFSHKNKIDKLIGIGVYPSFVLCFAKLFLPSEIIISERNSPYNVKLSKISRLLRWLLYRFADKYVFQTEGARKFYSKNIQKRSIVIHNPIKNNLPLRSTNPLKEIIAVGRLIPQKNYPLLIKAFKIISKVHTDYNLRIFGVGNEEKLLKKLVKDYGLESKVIFEGYASNVHEAIKNSEIYVMTSDFEGMPNSLMEAMGMGFPVVTTDCPSGGPKELINNKVNGILIRVGDYIELANNLNMLIEHKEIETELSKEAIKIRETHSQEKIFKCWEEFLINE